jgi:hypothetical protein
MTELIYINEVLEEMHKRVGVPFSSDSCNEEEWYTKHTWTQEEQDSFTEWLANYLHKNIPAQREMYDTVARSKKECKKRATYFVFSYGWQLKEKGINPLNSNN